MRKTAILWLMVFLPLILFATPAPGTDLRIWFDWNDSCHQTATGGCLELDTKQLKDGIHWLNVIAIDEDGNISSPKSKMFLKKEGVDFQNLRMFIDGESQDDLSIDVINDSSALVTLDTKGLTVGLHTLRIFYLSSTGAISSVMESFFLKDYNLLSINNPWAYFIIDGKKVYSAKCYATDNIVSAEVDLSDLQDGLHSVDFMVMDKDINSAFSTQTLSSWFVKVPSGGNEISGGKIWINDDSGNSQDLRFTDKGSAVSVIQLIDIPSYPFRSTSFSFAFDNDSPVTYAKNDANFMFWDKTGRLTLKHSEFVDQSVRRDVNVIRPLQSSITENIGLIPDNDIRWYSSNAMLGDSLIFKTNRGATIEVFDPDGNRTYYAQGIKSINSGGFRVKKSGLHYVALHDVSDMYSDLKLDYSLIDKYTLLDHTPQKAGNAGFINMDLHGNGMLSLKSAQLERDGLVCPAENLVNHSQEYSVAQFAFYNKSIENGSYDLKLTYSQKAESDTTIIIKKAIELESPSKNLITSTLHYNVFRDGNMPHKAYVEFENNSNVGCGLIPINIAITGEKVYKVGFSNFGVYYPSQDIMDSIPAMVYQDNIAQMGKAGYFAPLILPYLGPNERITLELDVYMSENSWGEHFGVYGWVGKAASWGHMASTRPVGTSAPKRIGVGLPPVHNSSDDDCPDPEESNISDIYGLIDAVDNIPRSNKLKNSNKFAHAPSLPSAPAVALKLSLGIAESGAGIVQAGTEMNKNALEHAKPYPEYDLDANSFKYRYRARSPQEIACDVLSIPTCPTAKQLAKRPCPRPDGWDNVNHIPLSSDPNEIAGYSNNSGGPHIGMDVTQLEYRIMFENDSTMATMPANQIIIKSLIDKNIFDLSSFKPLSVKFGKYTFVLEGQTNFTTTYDLRTDINAIAEVSHELNPQSGESVWTLRALDPITLLPIKGEMYGLLPVNNSDKDGEGAVSFQIDLRDNLDDNSSVRMQSSIIFDQNDPIETNVWRNVTDYIRPISCITDATLENGKVILEWTGEDSGSGIAHYDLYYNRNDGDGWIKLIGSVKDSMAEVEKPSGVETHFCVISTDNAGNRETKDFTPELIIKDDIVVSIKKISADDHSRHQKCFDLYGRRVVGKPHPGIYIINGEKVLIR